MSNKTVIAKRIRQARMYKGMTMRQLAAEAGIDGSSISCYESGKRRPRVSTAMMLSKVLGCPHLWLLGEDKAKAICAKAPWDA